MKDEDGKRSDTEQERLEKNQARLKQMKREDDGEFRNSHTDPEFTVEDLARMSGKSREQMRRMLRDAGIGFPAIRVGDDGRPRKTTICRLSQLKSLQREMGWE